MVEWIATNPAGLNRQSLENAARTAIAATLSAVVSRVLRLPEVWWAAITAMVVMQSTLGASLSISTMRLIGTALGAVAGAVLAIYFGPNLYVFGAGVFLLGLLAAALHLERAAFRFAGITLAIVMLILRVQSPWITALHRFLEVSLGIMFGLLITLIWPERPAAPAPAAAPASAPEL
jgi:uncharacterized membrane protein YgaE (UPF0421/DUF939 family)